MMMSIKIANQDHGRPRRVLHSRELNRTLLARQLLMERANLSIVDTLEHLIGMQSQAPNPPYCFKLDQFSMFQLNPFRK